MKDPVAKFLSLLYIGKHPQLYSRSGFVCCFRVFGSARPLQNDNDAVCFRYTSERSGIKLNWWASHCCTFFLSFLGILNNINIIMLLISTYIAYKQWACTDYNYANTITEQPWKNRTAQKEMVEIIEVKWQQVFNEYK